MNRRLGPSSNPDLNVVLRVLPAGGLQTLQGATAVTGSYGEAITCTRASTATMVKSDGTVVTMQVDQARIEPAGLLCENAATNLCIRSEEFDNAAWTKTNATVTANAAVAPDGAATADLLATSAAGGTVDSTAAAIATTSGSCSVWVRTFTGTQAGQLILRDSTAGADRATTSFTATPTWTRVSASASATLTGGNNHLVRILPGGAGEGALLVWGAQMEATAYVSSYIPTGAAAASRAADEYSIASTKLSNTAGAVCADVAVPAAVVASNAGRVVGFSTNVSAAYVRSATEVAAFDGTNEPIATVASILGRMIRVRSQWSGSTLVVQTADASASGSYDGDFLGAGGLLFIGSRTGAATNRLNGNVGNLAFSTSSTGAPL